MKKSFSWFLALLTLSMFLISSCDKKSTPPKTKTQLLTQASWKFKSASVGGVDASSLIQACQKDNILVFASAGTGNMNEGASKCNAGDPDTVPFTWSFSSGETILTISVQLFSGSSNDFTISKLTETTLVLTMTYTPVVGPTQQVEVTFEH